MPYQFRTVIDNLAKRKDITILKQDKGRGVVIMDRGKYTEKCFNLLNTEQFLSRGRLKLSFLGFNSYQGNITFIYKGFLGTT